MDLLDIPDKIWELILCNLSERDLLNASETCKKFNDLFSTSHKVLELLCLKIEFPAERKHIRSEDVKKIESLRSVRELKLLRKCLRKSERKYSSIIISNHLNHNDFIKSNYNVTFDILKQFAGSVTQLTFLNTTLQDDHFFEVIQTMKKLKVLKFEGRGCDKKIKKKKLQQNTYIAENQRLNIVSTINEIHIEDVSNIKLPNLHIFDNITTLDVNDCWRIDFDAFEHFLSIQKSLKVLRLRKLCHGFMFKTETLSKNIKFSLDELKLNEIYWENHANALKFFKTQTNLKIISLDPCSFYACDDILVHLFGNNPQLKTVSLTTKDRCRNKIKDFSFCEGIVNHSVEDLTLDLDSDQDATQYLIALTKLFPNVKKFTFTVNNEDEHSLDLIHNWESLEFINCTLNINQYLQNIDLVEKLTTCTIRKFDEECKLHIVEFFEHYQNIKHLSIHTVNNEPINDKILVLIVNTLKSLETLICDGKSCRLSNYLKPVCSKDQCVERVSPFMNYIQAFSWKILFPTIIQKINYYFTKITK